MTTQEKKDLLAFIEERMQMAEKNFIRTQDKEGPAMAYAEKCGSLQATLEILKIKLK